MKRLLSYLLTDLPLWLVGLLTNWMPDNPVTCRARGVLARPFLGRCGRRLSLGSGVRFLHPRGVTIGDDVYVASGCWLSGAGKLTLEDEVVIGPYVIVTTAIHTFKGDSVRFGDARRAPVVIGRGTWIAAHVVVAAGVTVGRGNLVGANAVVTTDTPDDVFVGGVPARVIGPRRDNPSEVQGRRGV